MTETNATQPELPAERDGVQAVERRNSDCIKYDSLAERFGRADLIPLWVADLDFAAPASVQRALSQRAAHPIYGYTRYPPEFFAAIVHWQATQHRWQIPPEAILPMPGTVPALALIAQTFSQPGDGIVVQTPIYPPIHQLPANHGRRLRENPLRHTATGYEIDWDDLDQELAGAKLFILCAPHNPVGRVWRQEELQRIIALCKTHGAMIVADEVHADLCYAPHRHQPIAPLAAAEGVAVITLNAPSKTFNIAGLNTAYAVVEDAGHRAALQRRIEQAGLASGNPFGIRALIAAYTEGRAWHAALMQTLAARRKQVLDFFATHDLGIRVQPPEATYLLWLDCRALMTRKELSDDAALARFFIDDAGLALNPGISFGTPGTGFMRLNIGTDATRIQQALDVISQ
ncbi:MalY/PatB family protein [Halothiobacillus sp. DCM-1]|uniref:MalY/PatB family protein n=1 Tax=Halothiobacillus sp. DCM-1 TaxID=3112558 RepID=UPI00324BD32F